MLEPHFHLRRLCVARRVSLASRDARRTPLVSPACFCFLLRLLLRTRGRPAWHDSRHRQSRNRRRARTASGLARMNRRSRQSSIHHLAAELATCQPAAPYQSRTRHVANPNAPCDSAATAPDQASCAATSARLASYAAEVPEAAQSAQPGCNRVRPTDPGAAGPAPPRPRATPHLHAPQSPPNAPRTDRPAASLLHSSAAGSRGAARRCTRHHYLPDRTHPSHRGTAGSKAAQLRYPP